MKFAFSGLIIVLLCITAIFAFSGNQLSELERMDTSGFENPRRPGAVFFHDDHNIAAQLEECDICHHLYEDGVRVEDESSEDSLCMECHLLKPSQDNPISLQVAFHKQCKTCHFNEKKGPVFCGECHVKDRLKGRLQIGLKVGLKISSSSDYKISKVSRIIVTDQMKLFFNQSLRIKRRRG